jgi:poly-gamma-glutamate synthesis protein (capsule biosynthesis protein)
MTGRGVDQALPHPGAPELHEEYVHDARTYLLLAETVNGPIARPVDPSWPWGEVLTEMDGFEPAVRVMNLETSITRSDDVAPGKAVTYRMNPDNLDVLRVAHVDVWTLANNHILDYGVPGLEETVRTMRGAGLCGVGAGMDETEAWRPAAVPANGGDAGSDDSARVLVASVGDASSGVPRSWRARADHPGVAFLPDLSKATADSVAARLLENSRRGDIAVVSVHWGSNWGYGVPHAQRRFAHRLIEAGVHVVHGHSSHHPRPIEVYRGHLVLHGCGDLVNDYEGIRGYEDFRDDLRLIYLATLEPRTGRLAGLRMVPLRARRLSLEHAGTDDAGWLARAMTRHGRELGTAVELGTDGSLHLRQFRPV